MAAKHMTPEEYQLTMEDLLSQAQSAKNGTSIRVQLPAIQTPNRSHMLFNTHHMPPVAKNVHTQSKQFEHPDR